MDCHLDNPVDIERIYTSDCFAAALIFVKGHSIVVGGVAVGIAAIMVNHFSKVPLILKMQFLSSNFEHCAFKAKMRENSTF